MVNQYLGRIHFGQIKRGLADFDITGSVSGKSDRERIVGIAVIRYSYCSYRAVICVCSYGLGNIVLVQLPVRKYHAYVERHRIPASVRR